MISPKAWRDSGLTTKINGYEIYYKTGGEPENPALLLIHGYPTSSWDWQKVWDSLRKQFFVIAPDMLGFGFSDKPQKPYSIMEQADIMEAVLETMGIRQYHILAHDYGDTVAQEMIARQNEVSSKGQMLSVCFLNGGLFPETHHARMVQKLLISPLGPLLTMFLGKSSFRKSFSAVFGQNTQPTDEEIDHFWEIILYKNGLANFHRLIRYMAERRQYRERWVGALQKTGLPLRVIDGADDPVSGVHMTVRYRELVPHPDIVLLPGIGHYPQTEAPDEVIRHFLEFYSSLKV